MKDIQVVFHTVRIAMYIRCSGPAIGSSTAYIFAIFRPSTTGTIPLTTQILCAAIQWRETSQTINRNVHRIIILM